MSGPSHARDLNGSVAVKSRVARRSPACPRRSTESRLEGPLTTIDLPRLVHVAALPALYRSGPAPATRTLLDILDRTVRQHPAAPAIDDGRRVLTYRALRAEVEQLRGRLVDAGIGVGDRVGIRVPSGTAELYVAILAVLAAGAAYVPVDADDPDERAELVFTEADVCAVVGTGRTLAMRGTPIAEDWTPSPDADAWIIFTSGS